MNRRGFLGACLAACAAPAIVRADSLMRIIPKETVIIIPLPNLDVSTIWSDAVWREYAHEREMSYLHDSFYYSGLVFGAAAR